MLTQPLARANDPLTFFCDRCGQPLLLEGPASAGLRVQCPSCLSTVDVPVPAEEVPAQPRWFAMVRGSQVGPMGLGPLEALIRAGEVTAKTFLWCEGMAEWRRAEGLPQLASLLAATRPPKPANTADLSQLFSDLDLTVSRPMEASAVEQMLAGKRRPQPVLRGPKTGRRQQDWDDPAEDPRRFRRNSPWKVAIALVLALALPVAGLYALSTLRVVPLEVSRVDETTGARVQEPVFSAKGARGIKDLLLGKTSAGPAPTRESSRNPSHRPEAPRPAAEAALAKPAAPPEPKASPELKALYREGSKQDIGPPKLPAARAPTPAGSGPDSPALSRVVAQSSPAFQFCIEQQLKKNPRFRGGKILLLATIGPSGIVKQARVDRKDIDSSDLGDCLKSRARRLVFPAFTGDDVEVQIPLVLTAAL
jgi:hypothetical protein